MYLDDILFNIIVCIKLNKKYFETKLHALLKKRQAILFCNFFPILHFFSCKFLSCSFDGNFLLIKKFTTSKKNC
jgi:hypothetical protein